MLTDTNFVFSLTMPSPMPAYLTVHYICETASRLLFLSIHWARNIPAFQLLRYPPSHFFCSFAETVSPSSHWYNKIISFLFRLINSWMTTGFCVTVECDFSEMMLLMCGVYTSLLFVPTVHDVYKTVTAGDIG